MKKLRWIAGTLAVLNGLLGLFAALWLFVPIAAIGKSLMHFQLKNDLIWAFGCILIAIPGYVIWWTYVQASRNKPTKPILWLASAAYNAIGVALGLFFAFREKDVSPFLLWPGVMTLLSLWCWRLSHEGVVRQKGESLHGDSLR
jgi:hypothetical protein